MHLKSLTLRGFKSFASATTLEFEPGITCVVGPNGSGKSNVVDAIAWVMGEQGAKSLRGGKMEDVIFAGTTGRAPLGRAEVQLTIDNSDGALPIDYTEVTIARTMFRSGGSEYVINGESCRLLDVQELLSDSGIGHEMHVIVGQGRLDAILRATPEERRGFIEEAAGVLKHRKRKEKALRKLEAMTANLTRLEDLTGELRRQLKPLGRQAEVARRAQVIAADLRDSRLRILADDLLNLRSTLQQEEADEAMLRAHRRALDERIGQARQREAQIEAASADDMPRLARVNDVHLRLTALRERYAGLIGVAAERARHLNEMEEDRLTVDPDQLDRQADEAQASFKELAGEVARLTSELRETEQTRSGAEDSLGRAIDQENRQKADAARRRETLARLEGDLRSARSRLETRDAEIARLRVQLAEGQERVTPLETQMAHLRASHPDAGNSLKDLERARDQAHVTSDAREHELTEARAAALAADREHVAIAARVEALRMSLEKSGAGALEQSGVPLLGVLADFLRVEPGYESAIEAALFSAADADAVAVTDIEAAVFALRHLRASSGGRASVVIADPNRPVAVRSRPELGSHARWAADVIHAGPQEGSAQIMAVTRELLADVLVVENLEDAHQVLRQHQELTAVTRHGDLLGQFVATGGDQTASRLQILSAVEHAEQRLREVHIRTEQLSAEVSRLDQEFAAAHAAAQQLSEQHQAESSSASSHAAQLTLAEARVRSARDEADRIERSLSQARAAHAADVSKVHAAELQLAAEADQELSSGQVAQSVPDLDVMRASLAEARHVEIDARLAVRTAEERMNSHQTRSAQLRAAAAGEREARERSRRAKERRQRQGRIAADVLDVARDAAQHLEVTLARSADERAAAETARWARDEELTGLRTMIRQLAAEIEQLTTDVHRDEIARAEQKLRVEQVETKALEEFGVESTELLAEYGPDVLVPASATAPGDEVDPNAAELLPYTYLRTEQEKRLRAAEKSMELLGRVNPLALEEFTAMEERHAFLTTQLEDLKRSRKDLLDIVAEVDERVQQVFAEAFADVQNQFEGVFERLFPGGEGRLLLTEPDDLLNTGIEVEARPAGKKVKRLSLLSGGERSLTAVAFLISLFRARPSPFYLLDEVEAALDDINLERLLRCFEELRADSQVLIITHQKRTMEIADALYGVTMREGVTQVISQRMRELEQV